MLFLDLNMRKKVHVMDYETEELTISCENILDKSYAEYTRMFETAINRIDLRDKILLDVELVTDDKLEEADLIQFHQCLVSLFASRIAEKELRGDEARLSVDNGLAYVHNVILKKMINFKTKIDCFNLVLRCGNMVMDMTGGYYVSVKV